MIPLLQFGDRLEAGGVELVTIMFAQEKMATMMKMIKPLNQNVTMRMIADDDEECDTQAAKEVVNSVTVAAESVYPSTTAASLTTSWISTQLPNQSHKLRILVVRFLPVTFVVLGLLLI